MRGVVFPGERQVTLMEFPDPTPGPGEVVVEMKASAICTSIAAQKVAPPSAASRSIPIR
jgi:D-arabinose 1-dehydrogenase-like Zn-dependent alcohol dehydrogenase